MKAIQLHLFQAVHQGLLSVPCRYLYGAKPNPAADSHTVHNSDCSGYIRLLTARSTEQAVILPEGSTEQANWFQARIDQGDTTIKRCHNYGALCSGAVANDSARLFICRFPPGKESPTAPGHIWFAYMGISYECHGHTIGVSNRPLTTDVLQKNVTDIFELPLQ